MAELPTVFENRVRFDETDLQGIVYYGEYFTFMDEALTEFFRRVGHGYPEIADRGWTTHIVHAELDYEATATLGDVLENGFRVAGFGRSSITGEYEARKRETGERVAAGEVVHVAVDVETDEPIPVPEAFRDAVADHQDVPPETA